MTRFDLFCIIFFQVHFQAINLLLVLPRSKVVTNRRRRHELSRETDAGDQSHGAARGQSRQRRSDPRGSRSARRGAAGSAADLLPAQDHRRAGGFAPKGARRDLRTAGARCSARSCSRRAGKPEAEALAAPRPDVGQHPSRLSGGRHQVHVEHPFQLAVDSQPRGS